MKLGINQAGIGGEFFKNSIEDVCASLKKVGFESIEPCIRMDVTEKARIIGEEVARKRGMTGPSIFPNYAGAVEWIEKVRANGLDVVSAHLFGGNSYPGYLKECVPYLIELSNKTGIRQFVLSFLMNNTEAVDTFADDMNYAAEALEEAGINLCYHNHSVESMPIETGLEGANTVCEYLAEKCPKLKLQVDVGWLWYGGGLDAIEYMKKYADRVVSVHLKDFSQEAQDTKNGALNRPIGYGAAPMKEALLTDICKNLPDHKLIFDQDKYEKPCYEELKMGYEFVQKYI